MLASEARKIALEFNGLDPVAMILKKIKLAADRGEMNMTHNLIGSGNAGLLETKLINLGYTIIDNRIYW